jgi:hypothetical protein
MDAGYGKKPTSNTLRLDFFGLMTDVVGYAHFALVSIA